MANHNDMLEQGSGVSTEMVLNHQEIQSLISDLSTSLSEVEIKGAKYSAIIAQDISNPREVSIVFDTSKPLLKAVDIQSLVDLIEQTVDDLITAKFMKNDKTGNHTSRYFRRIELYKSLKPDRSGCERLEFVYKAGLENEGDDFTERIHEA